MTVYLLQIIRSVAEEAGCDGSQEIKSVLKSIVRAFEKVSMHMSTLTNATSSHSALIGGPGLRL